MKKGILTLFSILTVALVGCGNREVKPLNAESFTESPAVVMEVEPKTPEDYLHFVFTELKQFNFDELALPQDIILELQNPENSNFLSVLKNSVANLDYNIFNITTQGDSATIIAEITTANLEHIFELALFSAVEEFLPYVLSGGISIEDISDDLIENIFLDIYNTNQGNTVSNIVAINLVKVDDEWQLSENNIPLVNALTGNLYNFLEGISEFVDFFNQLSNLEMQT